MNGPQPATRASGWAIPPKLRFLIAIALVLLCVALYFVIKRENELFVSSMLLIAAFGSAVVGTWEKLQATEPGKRIAGLFIILFVSSAFTIQMVQEYLRHNEQESVRTFLNQQEPAIDEASGAASLDGKIYIVDDEERHIYAYGLQPCNERATLIERYRIRSDSLTQTLSNTNQGLVDDVDDLEAAAGYNGKLYVAASHSLTKKGDEVTKRELFLEIDRFEENPSGQAIAHVQRATTLKNLIKNALQKLVEKKDVPVFEREVNIEGLAIDPNGNALIGLRSPLFLMGNQGFAIVLKIQLESIFADTQPTAQVIRLNLAAGNLYYGITSLEYDSQTRAVLILGNSPQKEHHLPSSLWLWQPTEDATQTPKLVRAFSVATPDKFDAKPEAIVLHGNKGFVFLDALGHGGQRIFSRKQLGLTKQMCANKDEK